MNEALHAWINHEVTAEHGFTERRGSENADVQMEVEMPFGRVKRLI